MVNIPRWKIVLILATVVFAFLFSAPNVVNLPAWLPNNTVNLGLDLQGGSHLLLQVDVDNVLREKSSSLENGVRPELREQKVGYSRIVTIPNGIRVTLTDGEDPDRVRKILRDFDRDLDVLAGEDGKIIEAKMTEVAIKRIQDQTIDQSIEIVRRRVDETGTREPTIQRQGSDRIILQLPGVDDPERIKELLKKTAQLGFHLVDTGENKDIGATHMLPMAEQEGQPSGQTIGVARHPVITGGMLTNAQPSFDQGGRPMVSFRLNGEGTRKFCDVTREHTGKPFAIVLDKEVISAPRINEPICGGSAQITGQFTVKETNDLALLLRAGALPASLKVLEERTVGPSLGSDSVKAGKKACLMALLFVTAFACLSYGLFGVFASVGLLVNMIAIIAVMSMLQATLTLPGIAGIVLTIGLAIDANVLIFERIKEELRGGRSVISAIDVGYTRARTTIMDSNVTALIAALILYSFGTGPIKGFAVTMCIGVVTSYFCALSLTRLVVLTWLRWKKPKEIRV